MNMKLHTVLYTFLIATASLAARAGSLECQGNIISPGITEAQLLAACGEPVSRNGAEWRYQMPGDLPMIVVTGEDGVVMMIRDATDLDSPAAPLGDSP
jgi:hypothetical protein